MESDLIGLRGGWNTYGYVNQRPLLGTDPKGLFDPSNYKPPVVTPPPTPEPFPTPSTLLKRAIVTVCTPELIVGAILLGTPNSLSKCSSYPPPDGCPSLDNSSRCKQVRTECAADCSSMLPDGDNQSMYFQKCYSKCLADNGCLGVR